MRICTFRYVVFLIVILYSCTNKDSEEPNWSNSMLLEIPSKVRFQQYNRGNLVSNHSFEDSKLIKLDSVHFTYNVAFWKKDVYNVKIVDYRNDSMNRPVNVSHGKCAVKIYRDKANEFNNKGSGMMSDFIRVIPGMYDLFVDIKCRNVEPYNKRYNKFLNDALDIRLIYYDKAKQQINSDTYNPVINQNIDNSFKGYSFARFNEIDSLNWTNVKCVSGLYPFNESVIPDEAKFVRIYLGLKGTGEVYFDNVRFFYSKENLTPKERSTFYFDSLHAPLDILVPTPKVARFIDTVKYFYPDSGIYTEPFILVPKGMDSDYAVAELLIKNKLLEIFKSSPYKLDIRTINSGTEVPERYQKNALIISLGNTSVYEKLADKSLMEIVQNRKGGFVVDFSEEGLTYMFVNGNSPEALYNGCHLACQLFDKFTVSKAKIVSYPDFDNRSILLETDYLNLDIQKIIERYGINVVYKPGTKLNTDYIQTYKLVYLDDRATLNNNSRKIIVVDNKSDLDIKNDYNYSIKLKNSLENILEHADHVYFMPVFNSNEELWDNPLEGQLYFAGLDDVSGLTLLWHGAADRSHYADGIQKKYYENNTGLPTVYVNNFQDAKTPSIKMNDYYNAYPEKIPMGNIFDPFDNVHITLKNQEIMLHVQRTDILSAFRIATFAEYSWNNDMYDPELSLFKILVNEFGKETARYLYIFNDAYCGLLTTTNTIVSKGVTNRTSRSAENEIASLNIAFNQIKKHIPEKTEFTDVLMVMKKMLIEKFHEVYEKALVDKKIKEDSLVSANLNNDTN